MLFRHPPPAFVVFVVVVLCTYCMDKSRTHLIPPSLLPFCFFFPSRAALRRFYKHWYTSKKKAFTRYAKKFAEAPQEIDAELARIKQYAQVVRVIAHTQVSQRDA